MTAQTRVINRVLASIPAKEYKRLQAQPAPARELDQGPERKSP